MKQTSAQVANHYKTFGVQTMPKNRAIYLLHERCAALIKQACSYPEKRRELCNRAQNILAQLETSLNVNPHDLTASGLFYLYDYCYLLLEKDSDDNLQNAWEIIKPISETFAVLLKKR